MSPIDRCAVAFATNGYDFAEALERNYQQGFVFSTPTFFIMGSDRDGAWFIEGMAGDMSRAWSILPYELPRMTFERFDNNLRSVPLSSLKRLTHHAA
jgi:hypothetical protein